MGQAKQRGSLEERIAQAQQEILEGEKVTIEEAKRRLELPNSAEFIGYVIHLYDQDEFVGKVEETALSINRVYVKIPDLAQIYETAEDAVNEALKIDKYRLLVCMLFEVNNKHMIHDVWANFDDE
ncbi:hypothetical protein N5I27_06320 [Acinetobacter johnsonii]|uniref:Uncharacterized protein n=2 Tax=Acinetobacter TaxID=469 RepID=A0AA42QQG9_ACIJO|nr:MULTISPECIES: hypothetical protein [Acinetobacter]MBC6677653.1 hypothetical protein [Acinetobacter sp.]MDH1364924.1 hypothetical protein [Acinetobacter johnsonii]MDH1438013.1 hypothetical protein [Acinetobacter johnsonii]